MQSISETFGKRIWQKTLLVLTHGNLPLPPPGTTFGKPVLCGMLRNVSQYTTVHWHTGVDVRGVVPPVSC